MEEEEEDISSPFWAPSTRQGGRHRRSFSSSSFLFNSGALLVFLLAIAVAFIFIIIPSIQSFTSQIFKPHSVKKSWDSLNLVLVLFAIICGFLSRSSNSNNNNNNSSSSSTTTTPTAASRATTSYQDHLYKFENRSEEFQKSNPVTPRRSNWYDHPYSSNNNINNGINGGLSRLRSVSSHPDLRQEESLWLNRDDQWRFYDDTHLYHNRFSTFDYQLHQWRPQPQPQPLQPELQEVEKAEEKKADVVDVVKNVDGADNISTSVEESEKEIIYTPPPPESPKPATEEAPLPSPIPPLPPPQTNKVARRRVKRTHQENRGNYRNDDLEVKPPSPPPRQYEPPPPLPEVEESGGRTEKKRGSTSATKEFLISLRRKKKKKQRQKSVENLDSFFNYEASYPFPYSTIPPPSPPPPPPPLPPPPFFQNIFSSKKRKAKKIHSLIPSPPPLPPPLPQPRRAQRLSTSASAPKVETRNAPSTYQRSPLPVVKVRDYSIVEENLNSGNASPLNSIPPPPPLPPFKMSAWKFEVQGDYVRLKSNNGGSENDVEESSSPSDGGDSPAAAVPPLFCPSPDVNTKADNFIARFRAGLRLEKMNSVKEKEGRGRSNLGPQSSPSPSPSHQEGEGPC